MLKAYLFFNKNDMDKTHWLQSPNKNYLGHWDLPNGDDLVLTIKAASWELVKDPISGKEDSKRVIHFVEDFKPLICNQTNAQSILKSTGIKFMEDSAGCKIQLFVDTIKDKRTKEEVDCIRIRNTAPKGKEVLNPHNPKWTAACESVKEGKIGLEGLRKHYDISDSDFNAMTK